MSLHNTSMQSRASLLEKLMGPLQKLDATMVTRQQKLKLFEVGICPCLAWDLSVSDFPSTWLQTKLQPLATAFLKMWSGLAKPADTSRLFLPKCNGGLGLPSMTTLYKKLHAAKAASHICSTDPVVRAIAIQVTEKETKSQQPCSGGRRSLLLSANSVARSKPSSMCSTTAQWPWRGDGTMKGLTAFWAASTPSCLHICPGLQDHSGSSQQYIQLHTGHHCD